MRKTLRYELYRLHLSNALYYSLFACILVSFITHYVIAGKMESPMVYGVCFEFITPYMLVMLLPGLFIGSELRGGRIKNILLSANSRNAIYFSKMIIYNIAICIIILFYLLIMTFWNIKGLGLQEVDGMNSFVYFLRCFGIGSLFCITVAAVLFLFATIAKNAIIPIVSALGMFFLDMILSANLKWAVAEKIVPSIILQNMMDIDPPKSTVITFFVATVLITVISYGLSLLIFKRRTYK